jgi:predicted RNA-binding protein YlxR (DUF448 family)
MVVKKIPMRTCVVTREQFPKMELIRVIRTPEGEITIDTKGKANGRGAYLKKDIETFEKAEKTKILNKKLEVEVPSSIYEELKSKVGV